MIILRGFLIAFAVLPLGTISSGAGIKGEAFCRLAFGAVEEEVEEESSSVEDWTELMWICFLFPIQTNVGRWIIDYMDGAWAEDETSHRRNNLAGIIHVRRTRSREYGSLVYYSTTGCTEEGRRGCVGVP